MPASEAYRIGIGYDLHRLVEGRRLVLGGVEVPYDRGLLGHSDADVLLHAVTDAILGASGLPDIGELFPDTDPRYKDVDSGTLLYDVVGRVRDRGFVVGNVDVVVHAEKPKLSAFKQRMAESVANRIGVSSDQVSIKAKTNEGLDAVGVGDAIACTAVALLVKKT